MADQAWLEEFLPNDAGAGHRWSWLMGEEGTTKNLLWSHPCSAIKAEIAVCWIDLASGTKHRLVAEDPLTLEPSILCPIGCGDHGYLRDGIWVSA